MSLVVLHTNDLHGKLTEAQAHHLRLLREPAGPDVLLLDAGDAVVRGNVGFLPGGEWMHDLMLSAGYDAAACGNREFHFTEVGFRTKLSRAQFPILGANIRLKSAQGFLADPDPNVQVAPPLPVTPCLVKDMPSGRRVVVLGLVVPMVTERMKARYVSAYLFEDPLVTAQRFVPILRNKYKPDLLIALSHIGYRRDQLLAEKVQGIDLIIGGHSHTTLAAGETVRDTLIVQTGAHAKSVGRVVVDWEDGRINMSARLEPL